MTQWEYTLMLAFILLSGLVPNQGDSPMRHVALLGAVMLAWMALLMKVGWID